MIGNYNIITIEDYQKDQAAIIKVLAAIKDNKLRNDLELINYYKEVPIRFKAAIDVVDRDVVDVIVHKLQAVVMVMQKATFIKSNHLPHIVLAKVLKYNQKTNVAFLDHLSYVTLPSERRRYVRVELSERHSAVFKTDDMTVQGRIQDISIGGLVILAPEAGDLDVYAVGAVSIDILGMKLDVQGKLLRIGEESGLKKYVIELEENTKCERVISKFVNQQQLGIINELKKQYLD